MLNEKPTPFAMTVARCALTCLLLLLSGCYSSQPVYRGDGKGGTTHLGELQQLKADSSGISETVTGKHAFRANSLKETAMSTGAQSGLAWRSKLINEELEKHDATLRRIFNFNAMLLNDNVLPPVLSEGRDTLKLDDPNTIRLADRSYKIIHQARFVTNAPTWREYLVLHFKQPPRPDNTLLPSAKWEKKIWDKYVTLGWQEGIRQANTIYEENLARLKRDFKGMALYRSLLAQRMVSMPFVAKANLGVTGGGENMRVNDQVLRITALPSLQTNTRDWKPALSPAETNEPKNHLE